MDGHVETHAVIKVAVVEAKHASEVTRPVQASVEGGDLAILERVAVDEGGQSGQLGNQINAVLVCVLPIVVFREALGIGLGKLALALHGADGRGELAHWVEVGGELGDHINHVAGKRRARGPLP